MVTTIPSSNSLATRKAATAAAPDDIPTNRPSSLRNRLVISCAVFRSDLKQFIREGGIINSGLDGSGHMLESFQPVEGSIRLKANDIYIRQALTQIFPCSCQSSRGAKPGNKVSDFAICLRKDFGPVDL